MLFMGIQGSFSKYTSIPFGVSFVRVFARQLIAAHPINSDPFALAKVTVWVPSQRAVRALHAALVEEAGGHLLLPNIRAMHLGDEDAELLSFNLDTEDSLTMNPVPETARLLFLAQQVRQWQKIVAADKKGNIQRAYDSANSLKTLSDRLIAHNIAFDRLSEIIPADMATHWEQNLSFLKIVFEFYPQWLNEEGFDDPAVCRNRLLLAQANHYRTQKPASSVYVAGFSDSTPTGMELIKQILSLTNGYMVLHGFDSEFADIDLPLTHPQYGIMNMLHKLGIAPKQINELTTPGNRSHLLRHVLLPAGHTTRWLSEKPQANSYDGLTLIEAPNNRTEADVIALLMRQVVATPDKTCALVTTDRTLALRVSDRLKHWELVVNDSAGRPLPACPAGSFFISIVKLLTSRFNPPLTAQLLSHPFSHFGQEKDLWKNATRAFETLILRGTPPPPNLSGLQARFAEVSNQVGVDGQLRLNQQKIESLQLVLTCLQQAMQPLLNLKDGTLRQWITAHLEVAQAISVAGDGGGNNRFLEQEDGDVLYTQLEALINADKHTAKMSLADYSQWLEAFLQRAEVREKYAQHPRLFIWGPLEARLQNADCIILGGMNEGTWPNIATPDPWLSRDMTAQLGLPLPDMALGLNAHDFSSLANSKEVFFTRAIKSNGTPTVPSRYLLRLQAVLAAVDEASLDGFINSGKKWLALVDKWNSHLEQTPNKPERAVAAPPLSSRPTVWSASLVRNLMNCPYRVYGDKILRLNALEPFEQAPDAADRGELVHRCLEAFFTQLEGLPPPWLEPVTANNIERAEQRLLSIADSVFAAVSNPASKMLWLSRFSNTARAFVEQLAYDHKHNRAPWTVESRGEIELAGVTLHARADRIDTTNDGLVVMDYKTGKVPTMKAVQHGLEPQMGIEALIMDKGGYKSRHGVLNQSKSNKLAGVEFWKAGGGDSPYNKSLSLMDDAAKELVEDTFTGITNLAEHFLENNQPMAALPEVSTCTICDFAGVCRRQVWQGENDES